MAYTKKTVFLFCLSLLVSFTLSASTEFFHIVFSNFPEDPAYRAKVAEFIKIYPYVNRWTPEWNYKIPKEEATAILTSLLKETTTLLQSKKTANIDLMLFKSLLMHCCYNLDIGNYNDAIIDELENLKKKSPTDYRAPWLLAYHYCLSAQNYKAIAEYNYIFGKLLKEEIPLDLFKDFIETLYMNLMFENCKRYIDNVADQLKLTDKSLILSYYETLERQLLNPPFFVDIKDSQLFTYLNREDGPGVLCRLFGLWAPVKENWEIAFINGVKKNNESFLILSFDKKDKKNREITSTLLLYMTANNQDLFEVKIDEYIKDFKDIKDVDIREYTKISTKWDLKAFEYRTAEIYPHLGGAHGIIIFIKRPEPKYKGIAIEKPSKLVTKSGLTYISMQEQNYTRFDGEIYYRILLDTCESVFPEAEKELLEFVNKLLLD